VNTLYFEKISRFDRHAEPVTVSIPFARGRLPDPQHLAVWDGDSRQPVQARALATWGDGSVKWLLVHLQPDLPGNLDKTLHFEVLPLLTPPPAPAVQVRVGEGPAGIRVDTGPLSFRVPVDGFLPIRDIALFGQQLWTDMPFDGFAIRCNGQQASTRSAVVRLEVEEAGPLRAVILVSGAHRKPDGAAYLDFRGRVIAYAGKPYVQVEYQFIHREEPSELSLEEVVLRFRARANGSPRLALGEGIATTRITESQDCLALALSAERMLYEPMGFIDSYSGDFWADWRDDTAGLALSIHQAQRNFPKALQVEPGGITCWLFPADAPPARFLRGMAKTHRLQLHFHAPDLPPRACSVRSLQFQMPDWPRLTRAWYRENNPWREAFFPEVIPNRLISFLSSLHDQRPRAMGMFHVGDAPDSGYSEGTGRGQTVWVNNEYDRPHCCTLFYCLTGQRRVLDSALVSGRHWLDVDLCHYHPDPLVEGGLGIHSPYHVTRGAKPSHEWTEGILDYYFLTGQREALEGARSVAENIMRHMALPEMRTPGEAAVREGGWALRALVGMWHATGEESWKAEAKRIAHLFVEWFRCFGGLMAPHTDHTLPRTPFQNSITAVSLGQYLLVEDDPAVRELIVAVVDDMIEHCTGPDGVFFFSEFPAAQLAAPTPHVLDALTYAYRITGKIAYLKIAARNFAALMDQPKDAWHWGGKVLDASGAIVSGHGSARSFENRYPSLVLFAGTATPLGLLDWYEYAVDRSPHRG